MQWLIATIEACTVDGNSKEFYKIIRDSSRAFVAQRCSNYYGSLWWLWNMEEGVEGASSSFQRTEFF